MFLVQEESKFYPVWARSKSPTRGEDISTSSKATHHCLGAVTMTFYAEVSSCSFAVTGWFRGLCRQGSMLLFWDALAMERGCCS